jgi:oligopeptidase A
LDGYLSEALALVRDLTGLVRSVVRSPAGLAVDFPRFLAMTACANAEPPLLLPLDACIGLLAGIAERIFGLALDEAPLPWGGDGRAFLVRREQTALGIVVFAIAEAKGQRAGVAEPAPPATARPNGSRSDLPVGRVLCRLAPGRRGMSFDATRVLFHEFGHALVHVLAGDRKPGTSGLDDLPVERLELLSTWLELWVYHRALEDSVLLSERERAALDRARRVKALEFMKSNLNRAVCALADFQIHADPAASVRDVMRRLRARHTAIDVVVESEVLADFAHPLLLAHPGCSFVYPFASSYAAEHFLPLLHRPLREIGPELCAIQPALGMPPSGPCPTPDATAPGVFFRRVVRTFAPPTS